jgi:transposase-like protein
MPEKKGSTHYEISVKEEAVKLFLEEGYTYKQIAEKLEIRRAAEIKKWVHQYRQEGKLVFRKSSGRPHKVEDEKAYIARLEMENKILKKLQSELREAMLAKRDIGQSATTKKSTK